MNLRRCLLGMLALLAAVAAARGATAMLESNIDRPLRYQPDGTDFVIVNSPEYFNRPLYTNTAFRVDGGDVPEFSLFLPGHGGNLRLGILTDKGAKWINSSAHIVARYRPGSLVYEISDPLLGDGAKLNLTAMVLPTGQGLIVRVDTVGALPVTLVWAYGGADGNRGSRDMDIGTERTPVGRLLQITAQNCAGNTFDISANAFTLHAQVGRTFQATIEGIGPTGAKLAVADANQWNSLPGLLASAGAATPTPVIVGQAPLTSGQPVYLALRRAATGNAAGELATYVEAGGAATPETAAAAPANANTRLTYDELPKSFEAAEAHRKSIAEKITADTPDPYINAAVSALCVAADGIWDDAKGAFMHGAVAWRSSLLGWRGPYSGDTLGYFDREVSHLTVWAAKQNVSTIVSPPPPDRAESYARDEPALHSNGDLSKSHYDMNLVYIDAVFRHLLWTGDLDFARAEWPVIQRHLAWEQRLFRRPFGSGPVSQPLYEAYAAIWASDDLEYSGGGATHATAYNYCHNLMAAKLAALIGEDPKPYQEEADRIRQSLRYLLWIPSLGWYAEFKDWLGAQLPHPSPAVWTFYHTIDSQAATPLEAWQMSRYVDTQIPHFPIRGAGVPDEGDYTVSTTDWMPYDWSLNNVVMAESAHTSLAYWQANRREEAYKLFKGCILNSMYQGLCPGNAGAMTIFDSARLESQRDFGDGIGALSRALVEGLFGVRPDALAGELVICPGFPAAWDHASFHHPSLDYSFHTEGPITINTTVSSSAESSGPRAPSITTTQTTVTQGFAETYSVTPRFPKPMALRLQVPALREDVANITVNGKPAQWTVMEDAVETPRIEITVAPADHFDVRIVWTGAPLKTPASPAVAALGQPVKFSLDGLQVLKVSDTQGTLNELGATANTITGVVMGAPGFRTVFAFVQQGAMRWWAPLTFESRPAFEIRGAENPAADQWRFTVRNNTAAAFDHDAVIHAGGGTMKTHLTIPALAESAEIALDGSIAGILPGTNAVTIDVDGKPMIGGDVTNWKATADAASTHFEPVNLAPLFNDSVTQIFRNQYLTPRSPFPSLSIFLDGSGMWTANFTKAPPAVDDRGLRAAATKTGGNFTLPQQGVVFQTPGAGDAKNIVFTSQWDNYPRSADIPLTGKASHVYLLMAGSTNPMQSRFDNGEVIITYADGTTQRLALENPTTWWPIDQDYFIDDFAFHRPEPIPPRVDLMTGNVRTMNVAEFKGRGGTVRGGAATVLDLPLDSGRELKSLTVHAIANEVVIGLMAATLVR